jgi:hypothetical protein
MGDGRDSGSSVELIVGIHHPTRRVDSMSDRIATCSRKLFHFSFRARLAGGQGGGDVTGIGCSCEWSMEGG